jgi:hypothetical protein
MRTSFRTADLSGLLRVGALALACLAVPASIAHAQDEVDPAEAARFRFGPLRFTPSLTVSDIGTDDNVFNESVDQKQDTTAAIGPATNLWLRLGRSQLSGKLSGQYLYFDKYESQRSWNTIADGRWELRLTRLTPFVTGTLANTKDRPGYEIDARARRDDRTVGFGTALRLSSKTSFEVGATRSDLKFDNLAFLGVDLAQQLNRRSDTERLDMKVRLTPLTTFVVRSEAVQDRFDHLDIRNTDSFSVSPGFELRPEALISGEAFVGVRRFETLSDVLPDYTGLIAAVKTRYTLRATRVALNVSRDLTYSYENDRPYYALTDVGVEVTERVTYNWDLVGRTSRQSLAYRNAITAVDLDTRTDHSWLAGGGIGYRIGQALRVGFDANYYRRTVDDADARSYRGLRMGASISYGLPQ